MRGIWIAVFLSGCGIDLSKAGSANTGTDTGTGVTPTTNVPAESQQVVTQPTSATGSATGSANTTSTVPTEDSRSYSVADSAKLPTCNGGREGALAYIRREGRFVVCEGGNWNSADMTTGTVDISDEPTGANCASGGERVQTFYDKNGNGVLDRGEGVFGKPRYVCDGQGGSAGAAGVPGAIGVTGATGATGADGARGEQGIAGVNGTNGTNGTNGINGTNGTDNHVAAKYTCTGSTRSNLFYGPTPALYSTYIVTVTSYGDVQAESGIYWDETGAGTTSDQSGGDCAHGAGMWAKADIGATTAPLHSDGCNWVLGHNDGIWDWSMNFTAAVATATYTDKDMTPNSVAFPLACTKTTY